MHNANMPLRTGGMPIDDIQSVRFSQAQIGMSQNMTGMQEM